MSRQASLRLVHFRGTMVECKFYGTTHRDDALVGRDTVIAVFSHRPSWRRWLRSRKNCFAESWGFKSTRAEEQSPVIRNFP